MTQHISEDSPCFKCGLTYPDRSKRDKCEVRRPSSHDKDKTYFTHICPKCKIPIGLPFNETDQIITIIED